MSTFNRNEEVQIYHNALSDFIFLLEPNVEYTYQSKARKSKINYKYKQTGEKVISIERRQKNVTD